MSEMEKDNENTKSQVSDLQKQMMTIQKTLSISQISNSMPASTTHPRSTAFFMPLLPRMMKLQKLWKSSDTLKRFLVSLLSHEMTFLTLKLSILLMMTTRQ